MLGNGSLKYYQLRREVLLCESQLLRLRLQLEAAQARKVSAWVGTGLSVARTTARLWAIVQPLTNLLRRRRSHSKERLSRLIDGLALTGNVLKLWRAAKE